MGTFEFLGLPEQFGEMLLAFVFLLSVSPYAAGADFGLFKIPDFGVDAKRRLKVWGPVSFVATLLLFVPLWSATNAEDVALQSPFGDRQILLNGRQILIPGDVGLALEAESTYVSQKHLFEIRLPPPKAGMKHELVSVREYVESMSPKLRGFVDRDPVKFLASQPLFKDASIFRIYRPEPYRFQTTSESRMGPLVPRTEYEAARAEAYGEIASFMNTMEEPERDVQDRSLSAPDVESMASELEAEFGSQSEEVNLFNELSILIIDRARFERSLMVANRGRVVEASPLTFMLAAGGTLPAFDILSVKQAAVSANNRVWGFYGQRQFIDVRVDDEPKKVVYLEFYRLYAMNSAYLYQITLTYVPGHSHPRASWDYLVDALSSFRIVASE